MATTTTTKQAVQDLKSERVQEEIALAAEEPFRFWLKAERVQQPSALAVGPDAQASSAFELNLTINQKQPVTIELPALQTVIKLHGTTAGDGTAGAAQAPGLGEAG